MSVLKLSIIGAIGAAAAALVTTLSVPAHAYPDKPITYVIPFNPGGESDVTARFQQPFFPDVLGQEVVIKSMPGAGGATAWGQLNGMRADGYTIMNTIVPHTVLQPALKEVGYKTEDINHVYFFHYTPDAIVVRADSPFKTLQDLIGHAKENPGTVTFGGSGTYSANHLAQVAFDQRAGTKSTYIPFKGSAPAMTALLGGQIAAAMTYSTQSVKAGDRVRTLAVATESEIKSLPGVATFKAQGIDWIGGAFRGVAVPKGTPEKIKKGLSNAIAKINTIPEFRKKMEEAGFVIIDIPVEDVPGFLADAQTRMSDAVEIFKAAK